MGVSSPAPMRTVVAGVAIVAAISMLAALGLHRSSAQAGEAEEGLEPATWFNAHGKVRAATLTSVCGAAADGGTFCSMTPGRVRSLLPVRGRAHVWVRTRPGARRVEARLVKLHENRRNIRGWLKWSQRAKRVPGTDRRRWLIRLPRAKRLRRADALHVFFRYGGGAAFPDGVTAYQATYTSRIKRAR